MKYVIIHSELQRNCEEDFAKILQNQNLLINSKLKELQLNYHISVIYDVKYTIIVNNISIQYVTTVIQYMELQKHYYTPNVILYENNNTIQRNVMSVSSIHNNNNTYKRYYTYEQ